MAKFVKFFEGVGLELNLFMEGFNLGFVLPMPMKYVDGL